MMKKKILYSAFMNKINFYITYLAKKKKKKNS